MRSMLTTLALADSAVVKDAESWADWDAEHEGKGNKEELDAPNHANFGRGGKSTHDALTAAGYKYQGDVKPWRNKFTGERGGGSKVYTHPKGGRALISGRSGKGMVEGHSVGGKKMSAYNVGPKNVGNFLAGKAKYRDHGFLE